MMAGNPTNWWSMLMNGNNMHQQSEHISSSSSSSSHFYGASNSSLADNSNQDFPARSLSQLLLSGFSGDEEKFGISPFHQGGNSEDQNLNSVHIPSPSNFRVNPNIDDVKPELGQLYDYHHHVQNEFQASLQEKLELSTDFTKHAAYTCRPLANSWSQHQDMPSPASSCITTGLLNHNVLNFSSNKNKGELKHQHPDNSSECNSTSSGGISKKARVQHSSAQPSLKVRKEKLGDRITALHQLVSPFGKTDTASVLSEAIGYVRFLQGQIQALSSPYLGNPSGSMGHISQQSDSQHKTKDLRSRGLCLVPISCMQNVGSDTGADYWAPALGGSGF